MWKRKLFLLPPLQREEPKTTSVLFTPIGKANTAFALMTSGEFVFPGARPAPQMLRSLTTIDAEKMNKMRAIHPGEILRGEFMMPLGLSAHALAVALRVAAPRMRAETPPHVPRTESISYRSPRYC